MKEDLTQYDNFDKEQLKTEIFTLKEENKLLRQQLDDFRLQHINEMEVYILLVYIFVIETKTTVVGSNRRIKSEIG